MLPIVWCFSGHDPSGGAGIQADIEAIAANKAQAKCIITAVTAQNTQQLVQFSSIKPKLIALQAETLLAEFKPVAIKLGMLANAETVATVLKIVQDLPAIKVILDPVLGTGNNQNLSNNQLTSALKLLLPHTTLITPNQFELDQLGGLANLLELGVKNILLTTTDSTQSKQIQHHWHNKHHCKVYNYDRLPHKYHGSGCTLASSISANLANNLSMAVAIQSGLDFTWQTLKQAEISTNHQLIPRRIFL